MQRALGPMVLFLFVLFLSPCLAQNAQDSKPLTGSAEARAADTPETVVILPWIYQDGTPGAKIAATEFLKTVLTQSLFFRPDSFQIIPEDRVTLTWTKDMGEDLDSTRAQLPAPRDLLKLGQKLGADWVITGLARWHTRSLWIGLGPKTKSDCTVDLVIVDVRKKELSLDARKVKMDSAPKDDPLKAATALFLGLVRIKGFFITTLPFIVSGGPRTPREQSAVQLAMGKAIQPWLAQHPHNRKIDTGDENETK